MTDLRPSTVTAWIGLQRVSRIVLEHIGAALAENGLPDLSWYDALYEIEKAGDAGIRPFELKDRLLLPQYGTSRLLDRIEKAGLVLRLPSKDDGRGHLVAITDAGRTLRRRMWPVYSGALQRALEERMSNDQAEALAAVLAQLRHGLPSSEAGPNPTP